jgi:hypothetical protein
MNIGKTITSPVLAITFTLDIISVDALQSLLLKKLRFYQYVFVVPLTLHGISLIKMEKYLSK